MYITTQSSLHHSFSKAPNEREIESKPLLLQPTHYDGLDDGEGSSRSSLSRPHIGSDTKVEISYIHICILQVAIYYSLIRFSILKVRRWWKKDWCCCNFYFGYCPRLSQFSGRLGAWCKSYWDKWHICCYR